GIAGDPISSGDTAWMLTASALVLLMTPGLSFFYGGMVGFKNVVSTMLQSIIALGVISLVWVVVGFGLAFGPDVAGLGIIGCPMAHATWHPDGILFKWGVKDFAGGTVVHMSAGWAALAGALVLGRRKAHIDGHEHVPANVPFVLLGTGMLWFGWFGFNAG